MPSPRNAVNLIVLAKTVQVIVRRGALQENGFGVLDVVTVDLPFYKILCLTT